MRLKKYITEISFNPFNAKEREEVHRIVKEEIIPTLKADCAPFLREIKGSSGFAITGIEKNLGLFSKQFNRPNRIPIGDLDQKLRQKINSELKNKFGFDRNENVKFVTGNASTASNYGNIYVVFPIGDFKYFWSPKVENLNVWGREHKTDDKIIKKLLKSYTNKKLNEAIKSGNEIALHCKSYYVVDGIFRLRLGILGKEFL